MDTSKQIELPEGLRNKSKEVLGFHKIVGKTLMLARMAPDNRTLVLGLMNGEIIRYKATADWYVGAWVEHFEVPKDVFGAKVMCVVNSGFVQPPGSYELEDKKVYSTSLVTTKGYITLEFRNSGKYGYGGYLVNV